MSSFGFIKAAVASPKLKVANPQYNLTQICELLAEAEKEQAAIVVFPELSLTAYSCGDLFNQQLLLDESLRALDKLLEETAGHQAVIVAGLPLLVDGQLYNCAAAFQKGRILGVTPKQYVPDSKEFYEKRWFASGCNACREAREVLILGQKVPFGSLLVHSPQLGYKLGVEICEDLWAPIPPSSYLALRGANVIANLSASNELVAKGEYRRQLIAQQSARCSCAYLYASAGVHESTTDLVFSGDCLIYENGVSLASSRRFCRKNQLVLAEVDLQVLEHERQTNSSFADTAAWGREETQPAVADVHYDYYYKPAGNNFKRYIAANPFIPADPLTAAERYGEIFQIQVAGLAKRLEHTGSKRAVIGVSGGLDSTLALLVIARTYDLLQMQRDNILAVTMPGFGTTEQTYNNALDLMKSLGVSIREIDITKACLQHFADIGQDPAVADLTFENAQARERTQILMDLANQNQGLVIGTGDLSELALGWTTYNGDHMSMYNVNGSVPKTLVRFLVKWAADKVMDGQAGEILRRIINTPISPELLPPGGAGEIKQRTENIIGPYELHDFFLFYTLRYGMDPRKVLFLAEAAYRHKYSRTELQKWLRVFYKRFFNSQFKRSCLPDGPKVGSVSLSPRGDWRMPSDADSAIWLARLEDEH